MKNCKTNEAKKKKFNSVVNVKYQQVNNNTHYYVVVLDAGKSLEKISNVYAATWSLPLIVVNFTVH